MTELQADGAPAPSGEWSGSELPVEDLRELFVVLGKALRAYQLYDENNPVRHRFVEGLRDSLTALWDSSI